MVVNKGNPLIMGCSKHNRSYNFAIASENDIINLVIYNSDRTDIILEQKLDKTYKTGDVFACTISGIGLDRCYYVYKYYDGDKEIFVTDPYAKTVTDCEMYSEVKEVKCYLSRVETESFDWENDTPLNIPFSESIIYKLNVRGFTKSCTSSVAHKGTFQGIIDKLPHLKALGITAIELMPAYEYDECERFDDDKVEVLGVKKKINYWGYSKSAFYFAPKASFSYLAKKKNDYTIEFKRMVKKLHKNGIEVIMEMYFTDEPVNMIIDCMKYWVINYHIDGIHLYADNSALEAAQSDAMLSRTKIFTVYWNGKEHSFKNMANYNNGYMNTARKFLKGEENQLGDFVNIIRNNPSNAGNINYITNHNGFTMYDLVSYDRKHNEANGENNTDGENFNYSYNCGAEGRTRKRKIVELRQRQIKNAFMILMLSQGTPLILAGDEFENTQGGNNNPYCIDSETSWVNWKKSDNAVEIYNFLRKLINFRKENKILHMEKRLIVSDQFVCGYPDVSYHGENAWYNAMENYNRHIGIMYCSKYAGQDNLIYVAYNMHWESHELALPKIPEKTSWKVKLCSGNAQEDVKIKDKLIILAPRTITVLVCDLSNKNSKKVVKDKVNVKVNDKNSHLDLNK